MSEQQIYDCVQCGKEEKAITLSGWLAGRLVPPPGWDSEEYMIPREQRKDGRVSGGTAWFCSRGCRGRWLIRTEPMGYKRP